jgi:hypothetical protein
MKFKISKLDSKESNKMDKKSYLPKNSSLIFNKTFARDLWKNELLHPIIGAKNEKEASEWFAMRPDVIAGFRKWENDLHLFITELQNEAQKQLRAYVYQEYQQQIAKNSQTYHIPNRLHAAPVRKRIREDDAMEDLNFL